MDIAARLLSPDVKDDEVAGLVGDYLKSCEDNNGDLWLTSEPGITASTYYGE